MKSLISATVLAATLGLAASAYAGPQLVANAGFESTSHGGGELSTGGATYNTELTSWSNDGYNFVFTKGTAGTGVPAAQFGNALLALWTKSNGGLHVIPASSPDGGNFVALDGGFETGALSQTLNGLKVGSQYTVHFNYGFAQQFGFNGDTVQGLDVSLGGETHTTGDFVVPNHGFTGWRYATMRFTATDTSETLSFLAHGNLPVPPFALLDGISAAAPEPASWAMMIIGLGGLGALARRRRATVAA